MRHSAGSHASAICSATAALNSQSTRVGAVLYACKYSSAASAGLPERLAASASRNRVLFTSCSTSARYACALGTRAVSAPGLAMN